MISISDDNLLAEVLSHPVTASVFVYLRLQNRPIGVREVQRALQLGSSSTAHWHLTKLLHKGIIEQLQGNKYQVIEPYSKIRKIPMTIVLDHYLVGGKAIPGIMVLITFLGCSVIGVAFMLIIGWWIHAAFTGLFGLVVATFLVVQFLLENIRFKLKED